MTCSITYSKSCVKQPLSKRQKIGFQDQLSLNAGQKYCRMLQGEHSAIILTFIKLAIVIKLFVLSIFEWPFYTGFTVYSDEKISLSGVYHGRIYVERYGIRGTICRKGWDDNAADVVCRMSGNHNYGLELGTTTFHARYMPVWIAEVGCHGNESSLEDCQLKYFSDIDWGCVDDLVAAGALCYNREPKG